MNQGTGTARPWDFSMHLTCGCVIDFGWVSNDQIRVLTPRRKDGKFGSVRCPNGHRRRRVVYTRSSSAEALA